MNKIYLVWFRLENETEDRIRGVALNWSQAESMASNLEMHLKVVLDCNFEYGVKSYLTNQLPFNFIKDDGCFDRWGPENFGE